MPGGVWARGVVHGGREGGPARAGGATGVEPVMSCALSALPEVVLRQKLVGVMLPDPHKGVCGWGIEMGTRMDKGFFDGEEVADDRVGVLFQ